jgi:DNA-binding NtrC family response regulator
MGVIRLLLVDDERAFVDTLGRRLTARGFPVEIAYSGRDALDSLERRGCDVVLLDVRMPGMNGLDTLREISARYPLVKVILLSGHASIDVAVDGMRLGAVDYLLKPTDLEDILAKVESAFEKKRLEEEQSAQRDARPPE